MRIFILSLDTNIYSNNPINKCIFVVISVKIILQEKIFMINYNDIKLL